MEKKGLPKFIKKILLREKIVEKMSNIPGFALPQTEKAFLNTTTTPTNTTTDTTLSWALWIFIGFLVFIFIIFIIWAIMRSVSAPAAPAAPVELKVAAPPTPPPRNVVVSDDCNTVSGVLYPATGQVRVSRLPGSQGSVQYVETRPVAGLVPGQPIYPGQERMVVGQCA